MPSVFTRKWSGFQKGKNTVFKSIEVVYSAHSIKFPESRERYSEIVFSSHLYFLEKPIIGFKIFVSTISVAAALAILKSIFREF